MRIIKEIIAILGKDFKAETRKKEVLGSMLLFALITAVIMNFTLTNKTKIMLDNLPGLLWIIILFSGVLGINKSFLIESKNDCLYGINLAVSDSGVFYISKLLSNLVFISIVQLIVLPVFVVLAKYRLPEPLGIFLIVNFLGIVGFVSLGTFLAGLTINTNSSEMLLPIVLFPLLLPLVLALVAALGSIIQGLPLQQWRHWLGLILLFDFLYTIVPILLFEYIVEV